MDVLTSLLLPGNPALVRFIAAKAVNFRVAVVVPAEAEPRTVKVLVTPWKSRISAVPELVKAEPGPILRGSAAAFSFQTRPASARSMPGIVRKDFAVFEDAHDHGNEKAIPGARLSSRSPRSPQSP